MLNDVLAQKPPRRSIRAIAAKVRIIRGGADRGTFPRRMHRRIVPRQTVAADFIICNRLCHCCRARRRCRPCRGRRSREPRPEPRSSQCRRARRGTALAGHAAPGFNRRRLKERHRGRHHRRSRSDRAAPHRDSRPAGGVQREAGRRAGLFGAGAAAARRAAGRDPRRAVGRDLFRLAVCRTAVRARRPARPGPRLAAACRGGGDRPAARLRPRLARHFHVPGAGLLSAAAMPSSAGSAIIRTARSGYS